MLKFSVLLPTRDRLELLKSAIDSVRSQEYQNWEIIVADNCSKGDIGSYVRTLSDDRIVYSRSDIALTVTDNWNVANNLATGDYIVMLGDDDGLVPHYFDECLNVIEKFNYPEVLNYSAYIYVQPNVIPSQPNGSVASAINYFSFMKGLEEPRLLSKEVKEQMVRNSLNFEFSFGFNMQYYLYSRAFVEKLRQFGEFYQGPYPDYYTANMMMLVSESIIVVPKELVIIGVTPKSYGYYYHNNIEKEGMEFHNTGKYREQAPLSIKKKLCSVSEMDTAALVTFAIIPEKFPQRHDLNPSLNGYYKAVVLRIYNDYAPVEASWMFVKEVLLRVNVEDLIYFLKWAKWAYRKSVQSRSQSLNTKVLSGPVYLGLGDLISAIDKKKVRLSE